MLLILENKQTPWRPIAADLIIDSFNVENVEHKTSSESIA